MGGKLNLELPLSSPSFLETYGYLALSFIPARQQPANGSVASGCAVIVDTEMCLT